MGEHYHLCARCSRRITGVTGALSPGPPHVRSHLDAPRDGAGAPEHARTRVGAHDIAGALPFSVLAATLTSGLIVRLFSNLRGAQLRFGGVGGLAVAACCGPKRESIDKCRERASDALSPTKRFRFTLGERACVYTVRVAFEARSSRQLINAGEALIIGPQ